MSKLTIYKVFRRHEWDKFNTDKTFSGSPDDLADGFIHLSTREQVAGTLAKHFKNEMGLIIAEISCNDLDENKLKWEKSSGGSLFPHYYGSLPLTAVSKYDEH